MWTSLAVATTVLLLWGEHGHRLAGQAAVSAIPAQMPAFFRQAGPRLVYLNSEPDRWRARVESALDPAMDGAHAPEHFMDMERVPPRALEAPDRFAFLDSLRARQHPDSQRPVGAGPGLAVYRMLELTQRLRVEFRRWRAERDPRVRAHIEQRIVDDAGILGHYVADMANPAHTSIHHDRWLGDNPKGYTTERGFHARFETQFVAARVRLADVQPLVRRTPSVHRADLRGELVAYVHRSHGELDRLFQLDQQARFDSLTTSSEHRRFAAERLADGATMLRDLWWTAWVTSADSAATPRRRAP